MDCCQLKLPFMPELYKKGFRWFDMPFILYNMVYATKIIMPDGLNYEVEAMHVGAIIQIYDDNHKTLLCRIWCFTKFCVAYLFLQNKRHLYCKTAVRTTQPEEGDFVECLQIRERLEKLYNASSDRRHRGRMHELMRFFNLNNSYNFVCNFDENDEKKKNFRQAEYDMARLAMQWGGRQSQIPVFCNLWDEFRKQYPELVKKFYGKITGKIILIILPTFEKRLDKRREFFYSIVDPLELNAAVTSDVHVLLD